MAISSARRPALVLSTLLLAGSTAVLAQGDFGLLVEQVLHGRSSSYFGIQQPLDAPADAGDYVARENATAGERILLAGSLQAEFVARNVAQDGDMMAFWPDAQQPTHLVLCIEGSRSGTTPGGNGGYNPSIQRVELATGTVETILHGMDRCDGIRRTAWGTILATEETDDGRAYELFDPLGTTGEWVADRSAGSIRTAVDGTEVSTTIAQRQALPTMAWEGLTVTPEGVVIGGDELRPGEAEALDDDGGAIFKFVPSLPFTGRPLADLSESPLVSGSTYAMTISCRESSSSTFPQYGQGCEVGVGAWVLVDALDARAEANSHAATGYYRPEDLHADPIWDGEGLRFCWTNTGRDSAFHYAEVVCGVDAAPLPQLPTLWLDSRTGFNYLADGAAGGDPTTVVVNRLVEGDERFNSFDNLDFQPKSGILYVIEDAAHGEIFACLRDGGDRDLKSDGCVGIASVIDPDAEPTGFTFVGSGREAYVIIQHGEQPDELLDFTSNPVDGTTDDLIRITGFRPPLPVAD